MNLFKKSFTGILLSFLFFVGLGVFTPFHLVKAITVTVPSDYSNCQPVTVTFETDLSSYLSGDSINILGTAQQNSGDGCFVNTMKLGGALSQTNASQNVLTTPSVLSPSGSPVPNYLSGGPVLFTQAQNSGTQYAYFRFSMCEMCTSGNCGSFHANNSTANGQCTYVVGSSAYCVGPSCDPNGNNGSDITVNATPNPPSVFSGDTSTIIYSSTNATSCHISKNNVVKAYRCPTSGSYTTGPLTSNTQYQIECGREGTFVGNPDPGCSGGGTTAMNSLPFAKTNLFDKIKNFISNLIPEAIASQVISATAVVNITVTPPPPLVPQLIFNPSNIKDLVKAGSPPTIGSSQFMVTISGLNGSGKSCDLKNITSGVPIENYLTDKLNWSVYVSHLNTTNTFRIDCTGGIVSGTQTVLGQSGTLSSSATSGGVTPCIIPVGSSSCKVKTTWTTTNNQTVPSQVLTYFSGATVPSSANSGTDVDTTITSALGSTVPRSVVISTKNKVDSENNTTTVNNSTDNQLATLPISVSCATGSSWNSTTGICEATAIGVDIFADPAGPLSAPGATDLVWTMTGDPTSCDATGTDWSGSNIKNGDPVTHRSGMPAKTYNFGIVCHKSGAPDATDNVVVQVNTAANIPPVVNAGLDKTITLPTASTSATGTASDPDGSIASTLWTKTAGPSSFTITQPNSLSTNFTGLANTSVTGPYVFRLTATDNLGLTSYDDMTVTVGASSTAVPTVGSPTHSSVTQTSAKLGATVTSLGVPASISARGVCYGKLPSPSSSNGTCATATLSQAINVPYTVDVSSLVPNSTYYYRGYAKNTTGTGYSGDGTFTTLQGVLTVTANPTYYSVSPSQGINFTYTSTINVSPNARECRLLDYNYVPLTGWENADDPIVNNAPSAVGSYSYYIGCQRKNDNSIVGVSSKISVDVVASVPPSAPDLVITNTWPTNVYTGTTTFYATVLNTGTAGTGNPFHNRFQVSDKIDLSGTITNYDTTQMDPVESGVSKMTERAISFPTAGTYYMRACADIPPANPGAIPEGVNEGNNCSADWVELTVVDGAPDLIASTPTPTEVNTGTSTFYSNITNQGNGGTVAAFTNQFQVSTTANGSNIIGTYPTLQMSALGPYITGGTSVAINFPTAGTFYMRACADIPPVSPGKVTNESNELNNCSSWVPITVTTGYPDLVISNTSPKDPDDIWVGTTIFFASVTNQGEAGTGSQFTNRFQVSTLANGGGTVTNYDTVPMVALGPYITGATSKDINFPTIGTYYMRACADIPPNNPGAIPESDETNNCSADWLPITVQQPVAGVDLTASTTYPTYVPTGTTTFYSNITNGGMSGTILQFTNRFQVSTTSNGSNIIGTYDTAPIGPLGSLITGGTSKSINFPTLGTYYMRACADIPPANPGTIPEGDEGNNCSGWGPVYVEECANGATNYPICTIPEDVTNGQCDVSTVNTCAAGTLQNVDDSLEAYLWNCLGSNGGTTDYCSKSKGLPVKTDPGTVIFTATPSWIFRGRTSTLHWVTNADMGTCVGGGFDTGGQSTGSVVVRPDATTIYTINNCIEGGIDLGTKEAKVRVISPIIIEI